MKFFITLLLCLAFLPSFAASAHEIDDVLDACLAKTENQTTAGMTNCTNLAADNWDKELNRVYKKLMAGLDAEGKQNLKNSQLEWLKHRDLEFKLIGSVYAHKEGTMYVPVRAMNILTLTKNRAIELNSYL